MPEGISGVPMGLKSQEGERLSGGRGSFGLFHPLQAPLLPASPSPTLCTSLPLSSLLSTPHLPHFPSPNPTSPELSPPTPFSNLLPSPTPSVLPSLNLHSAHPPAFSFSIELRFLVALDGAKPLFGFRSWSCNLCCQEFYRDTDILLLFSGLTKERKEN